MSKHYPQAIFFDLGMVFVTFSWEIAIPRFAERTAGDTDKVRNFLASPKHDAFERGEMTSEEFFQFGRESTGFEGTLEEFRADWNEIFQEIPEAVAIGEQLSREYPIYLISNTNPWHAEYIEQRFPWMQMFARRFYSYEFGIRKPDARIYTRALAEASVKPEAALFLDDRLDNIEGARRAGIHSIHVPTSDILRAELEYLIVKKQESH
jgi:HAD superfamily hydrolase (TIGR01509 family)